MQSDSESSLFNRIVFGLAGAVLLYVLLLFATLSYVGRHPQHWDLLVVCRPVPLNLFYSLTRLWAKMIQKGGGCSMKPTPNANAEKQGVELRLCLVPANRVSLATLIAC
jgi:hypothetical protein